MSIRIMTTIWDEGPANQSERFVLLALADYANDAGECWPSVSGVARKTCLSPRGVQTIIKRLVASGWLSVDVGGGRKNCNVYRIQTPQHMHPLKSETPQITAQTPQMDAGNPAAYAPEPSTTVIKPSVEKIGRKKSDRDKVFDILRPFVGEKALLGYIEMRWKKRAPITEHAAELMVEDLRGKMNADDILNLSTKNNWTGIFPDSKQLKGIGHDNRNNNHGQTRGDAQYDEARERALRIGYAEETPKPGVF